MTFELLMMDSRREGREEGIEKGREEGIKKGRAEGELKKLTELVCRKLLKGKAPEVIAAELEENIGDVEGICKVAVKYSPDYDVEKIRNELMKESEKTTVAK